MLSLLFLSFFTSSLFPLSNAAANCPLYGPIFPKPSNLASSAAIQTALTNLNTFFSTLATTSGQNNSYSIQVFSGSSSIPLFSHYHTASNLPSLNSPGVKAVDADTVYRIGSITKIFTIYAFLIEAGQKYFGNSITDFVPELKAMGGGNAVTTVDWADVTIGDLASHMAGIASDAYVGDLILTQGANVLLDGFPVLPPGDIPDCGYSPICTRKQFFANFAKYHPAVAIAETPIYSNVAYQILAYAMENITGKNFTESLAESLLTPLNLSRTSYSTPDVSVGVIPGTLSGTEWSFDMGNEGPAGIIYSSANDLSVLGRSILQSEFLTPLQTRRWLKPATLTSDVRETVGYPWGIRRITLNDSQPYDLITSYNKGGNIGSYASDLTIIPELDIGFTILVAGDKTLGSLDLATEIGILLLPALQTTARNQATALYAGTYRADPASLFSITITSDPSKPGLSISAWTNKGKNMLSETDQILMNFTSPTFEARLYPTELESIDGSGKRTVTFKAIWEDLRFQVPDTMFQAACGTWIGPTGIVYGSQALDEFIFTLDTTGKVISVVNSALRVTLNKV